jgi:hypothetical protein
MTASPEHDRHLLDQLGDALQAATATDVAREAGAATAPAGTAASAAREGAAARQPIAARSRTRDAHKAPRKHGRRGTLVAAAVVAVIAVPGVAIAANALIGSDEVARSIPNATIALIGTNPTCTVVREGVEFDCTLESAPRGELAPGAWKDTVEPTVDDAKLVNGGCRSLNAAGTHWRCYIGREAVRQRIIGAGFLGQSAPAPGAG